MILRATWSPSIAPDGNGSEIAEPLHPDGDSEQAAPASRREAYQAANTTDFATVSSCSAPTGNYLSHRRSRNSATVTPPTPPARLRRQRQPTTIPDARGHSTTTIYRCRRRSGHGLLTRTATHPSPATTTPGISRRTVPPTGVAANDLAAASSPTSYPARVRRTGSRRRHHLYLQHRRPTTA